MKKFNKLSRTEMKTIWGGRADPKDDVECMLKKIGDVCDDGSQCAKMLYPAPKTGSYLRCINTTPNIPGGM